jgi:hypothetical protein
VPADDLGQDVEHLGGHGDDPLAVGLGRRDDQQRDDLTVGALILPDAQVGELAEFFDPDAGVSQRLDDDPCPEGAVLGPGEIEDLAGWGLDAHPWVFTTRFPALRIAGCRALEGLRVVRELPTERDLFGGCQELTVAEVAVLGVGQERG